MLIGTLLFSMWGGDNKPRWKMLGVFWLLSVWRKHWRASFIFRRCQTPQCAIPCRWLLVKNLHWRCETVKPKFEGDTEAHCLRLHTSLDYTLRHTLEQCRVYTLHSWLLHTSPNTAESSERRWLQDVMVFSRLGLSSDMMGVKPSSPSSGRR